MAMHRRFLTSTQSTRLPFLVPHSYKMLQANDPEYPYNLPADKEPCEKYIQEHIPPLPLSIRSTLINLYCPPAKRDGVRKSKKDEDCLVRLYCGKRRSAYDQTRHKSFFTLRNYGLCVDQMEHLGIDVDRVVAVLAKSLADCYWVAHIDANDSEWVFSLPRAQPPPQLAVDNGTEEVFNTQSEDKELFTMRLDDGSKSGDMVAWIRQVYSRQSTHSTATILTFLGPGQMSTHLGMRGYEMLSRARSYKRVTRFWVRKKRLLQLADLRLTSNPTWLEHGLGVLSKREETAC